MKIQPTVLSRVVRTLIVASTATAAGLTLTSATAFASSHREAPFISSLPQVDGTDLYLFRSYEAGRSQYVTLIANYIPLQAAYGGPNYFDLDSDARYEINVDNNGDAEPDLTFRFRFFDRQANLKVPVGNRMTAVPLKNIGGIGPGRDDTAALNARQEYEVSLVRHSNGKSRASRLREVGSGQTRFRKPADNIGAKSIPDYESYANDHRYDVAIPGCGNGRVFVGQRREGFAVNLGEIFDLVNTNPLGPVDGEANEVADLNVTSLALEVPIACLTQGDDPVVGAWTTASLPKARILNPWSNPRQASKASYEVGPFVQVSRLGMPLVNEVVIGLPDKDRFNASTPAQDAQFLSYVTHPSLPALLEILFGNAGAKAPTAIPRKDLITAFLTGVPGLNQPKGVKPSEMLRLNTRIPVTDVAQQQNLGVLAGDLGGFPNGRRPGDDVVDIELRVAMGALIADPAKAPNRDLPFTDGATVNAMDFPAAFPYLQTPVAGSPN